MWANMTARLLQIQERIEGGRWWVWPAGGISASWITGTLAQIDSTQVINIIALGVLGIGSACMGLYYRLESVKARLDKQKALDAIEIDEAKRASYARFPQVTVVSLGVPAPTPENPTR